ncbi:delta-lactam-biosynthetic de-N-acetylase [Paenibacillus sp. UNC451MF]|uniref:delta-lactam-biosynthetic de-N-acetylase n=1 Tax=Paenibacillus sp. UNC451MF TaxID=1449063 RepID=UPI0007E8D7AC|nr:polysaccharide deacetylase family protein [Paenibacillus sp. UNC451MF]
MMTSSRIGAIAVIFCLVLTTLACSEQAATKENKQLASNEAGAGNQPPSAPPATPSGSQGKADGVHSATDTAAAGKDSVNQPTESPVVASPEPAKEAPAQKTATEATYQPPSNTKTASANDKKALSWYYMKKPKGQVPNFPNETKTFTKDMKALWVGSGKKVYLTIDTGGPLGDTDLLIKSLKDNDAKANFFIAGYNVKKDPDFVRQLVADGHLVANHTMTHTDMNKQTDAQVKKEIQDYEKLYKEVTGKDIQPYFRFPYGSYNMHLLSMVSDMGYTSVFWSTAMRDWEPRKNGPDDPYNDIMNNLHDGNIILMHQGSEENIQALDRIIKGVKEAGYEFALLNDIQASSK